MDDQFVADNYVNVGRWFTLLHRRSQQFVNEACAQLELTFSEYIMLIRIFDHEGAKQDELATLLCLDKAVVTRTINSLQKKGLIYREQDNSDRRVRHIYLTDYGKRQHIYLRNIIQKWVDYLVEDMSPEQINFMIKGFDQLVTKAIACDITKLAQNIPMNKPLPLSNHKVQKGDINYAQE